MLKGHQGGMGADEPLPRYPGQPESQNAGSSMKEMYFISATCLPGGFSLKVPTVTQAKGEAPWWSSLSLVALGGAAKQMYFRSTGSTNSSTSL